MTLDVQFKLKGNPNYINYLRQNSYWYKNLNHQITGSTSLETDRLERAVETISLLQNILSTMK